MWDPSAAPPLDLLCQPNCCELACSTRTGQLCPLLKKEVEKNKLQPVSSVAPTEMLASLSQLKRTRCIQILKFSTTEQCHKRAQIF